MDWHAEHWPPDHGLMLRPRGDAPSFCRSMLAEKLLSKGDYDCDREIRTLELLKLRFGELNLLNCEARPALLAPASIPEAIQDGSLSVSVHTAGGGLPGSEILLAGRGKDPTA